LKECGREGATNADYRLQERLLLLGGVSGIARYLLLETEEQLDINLLGCKRGNLQGESWDPEK
jgi:hypothetical protein